MAIYLPQVIVLYESNIHIEFAGESGDSAMLRRIGISNFERDERNWQ